MAATTFPGISLKGGWAPGEQGWGDDMNENLFKLSGLVQAQALSRTAPLPVSPSASAIYIVPSGDPNADLLAIWDDGASDWYFYVPHAGLEVFVLDEGIYLHWNNLQWTPRPVGDTTISRLSANYTATVGDFHGAQVILMDTSGGDRTVTLPPGLAVTEPLTVVRAGAGRLTFAEGSGVLIHAADNTYTLRAPWSAAQVLPLGGDEFVLVGDLGS